GSMSAFRYGRTEFAANTRAAERGRLRDGNQARLARNGLIERIPSICSGDTGLNLVDHSAPAVAVGHDDHAVPLPDVRHEIAAKAPVATPMAHVPALAALVHDQPHCKRSDADGCDHLPRHRGRQDTAGDRTECLLNFDDKPRQIAWRGPEPRCCLLRIDVPFHVHGSALATVSTGRLRLTDSRERLLVRAVSHTERVEHIFLHDVGEGLAERVYHRQLHDRDASARVLVGGERRPIEEDRSDVGRMLAPENLHEPRLRLRRILPREPIAVARPGLMSEQCPRRDGLRLPDLPLWYLPGREPLVDVAVERDASFLPHLKDRHSRHRLTD